MIEAVLGWPPLSDALGLAALIMLAAPALAAARLADRTARFLQIDHGDNVDPRLRDHKRHLDDERSRKSLQWRSWHSGCLYTGYALAVASYVVKLTQA